MTPLHYAARSNSDGIAMWLIDHGADVNAKNEDGETPLLIAISNRNFDLAEFLNERGDDVNAKEVDGETPLLISVSIPWLAKLLIERGADVNAKNEDGETPLLIAATRDNFDLVELLIEHGADVNVKTVVGWAPLHSAASRNSLDMAKLLIEHSADVNAKNEMSLGYAQWLIEYGHSVDVIGMTPLHSAAWSNSLDVAKLLIERGADVNAKDADDFTPLDRALNEDDSEEMQALLRRHGGRCASAC